MKSAKGSTLLCLLLGWKSATSGQIWVRPFFEGAPFQDGLKGNQKETHVQAPIFVERPNTQMGMGQNETTRNRTKAGFGAWFHLPRLAILGRPYS